VTRVLYVNHTSTISGAERSLLELLEAIAPEVDSFLACPDGDLANAARDLGVLTFKIRPINLSFRLEPIQTSGGLLGLAGAAFDIARAVRAARADVVHANSVRAGMAAILARAEGAPQPIVHVRDVLPASLSGCLTAAMVRKWSFVALANSQFTASAIRGSSSADVRVVYNAVDPKQFNGDTATGERVRAELDLAASTPTLGVIAQLTPWKAQDDAIRTLALVRRQVPDAHLLLAGEVKFKDRSTRFDNVAYEEGLHRLATEAGVAGAVAFLGERTDIPQLLQALDILLVPSWEEPFGRVILEAMAAGTPVIATAVGGPSEIIVDRETGLLLRPKDPSLWAEAVVELLVNPASRKELAGRARSAVETNFNRKAQVDAITAIYEGVAAGRLDSGGPVFEEGRK